MSELTLGPFTTGFDNVTPEGALADGGLKEALNVDLSVAGDVIRRAGFALGLTRSNMDSVWTSRSGRSYCASGTNLCRVNCDGSAVTTTTIATLTADSPVSFDDLNGEVVFCNTSQIGIIDANDNVRPLGVENPTAPSVSNDVGSMDAGRYAFGYAYVADTGEESGLSPLVLVDLASGQGILATIPQPIETRITAVNLYRTEAGGEVLYLTKTIAVGVNSYLLTANDRIGRQANNQNQERMPNGNIVRAMRAGFLLVANDDVLFVSQSLRYGRYDPRTDVLPFPKRITMLEPVSGGVFVGTDDGVFFLAGSKPSDFTLRRTAGKPPIEGVSAKIDASELGPDLNGEVIWLARNGFVLGTGDGQLIEPQAKRFRLPVAQHLVTGSLLVNERRVTAAML